MKTMRAAFENLQVSPEQATSPLVQKVLKVMEKQDAAKQARKKAHKPTAAK
jgi:hypothetical protein